MVIYVSGPVGERFERYFTAHFPGFEAHTKDGDGVPDFYNPQFGFWVEAKAGNARWGVQLHARQLNFDKLREPVVYCMGLHSLSRIENKLNRKSSLAASKLLDEQMEFREIYFMTREVVDAVMKQETRISAETHRIYCSMKRHMFRDILRDRRFRRRGVLAASAQAFYGYDRSQFDVVEISASQDQVIPVRGVFLDKRKDQAVAEYLKAQGII